MTPQQDDTSEVIRSDLLEASIYTRMPMEIRSGGVIHSAFISTTMWITTGEESFTMGWVAAQP